VGHTGGDATIPEMPLMPAIPVQPEVQAAPNYWLTSTQRTVLPSFM